MLIQDIKPPYKPEPLPPEVMRKAKRMEAEWYIGDVDADVLITELWKRGVPIKSIFGQYYTLDEISAHHDDQMFGNGEEGLHGKAVLKTGDVELAGIASLPDHPVAPRL